MNIRWIKDCEPDCYNLEKWNIEDSPILLITGLSGSGKTTFAKEYALQHNAIYISFDVLKFYSNASKQSREILDIFLMKYPQIKQWINIQWAKKDQINSNDILFNYYCNLFFDFIVQFSIQNKKKIILEGIQIFVRLHPTKSVGLPIIIIRNSCLHSFLNKIRRDYPFIRQQGGNGNFLKSIINDMYLYYFKQRIFLDKYIQYLTILYQNTNEKKEKI